MKASLECVDSKCNLLLTYICLFFFFQRSSGITCLYYSRHCHSTYLTLLDDDCDWTNLNWRGSVVQSWWVYFLTLLFATSNGCPEVLSSDPLYTYLDCVTATSSPIISQTTCFKRTKIQFQNIKRTLKCIPSVFALFFVGVYQCCFVPRVSVNAISYLTTTCIRLLDR